MMEGFSLLNWTDISSGALIALIVLFILLGRLIPKSTHERELAAKDSSISYLHQANEAKQALIAEITSQNSKLLDAARTSTAIAESIQRHVDGGG